MAVANSLPPELVACIFNFSLDYTKDVACWKQSLPFLKICRSWRAAVFDLVYSCMFCNVLSVSNFNSGSPTVVATSNFSLIKQHFSLHRVKQLSFSDHGKDSRLVGLFLIMSIFGVEPVPHEYEMLHNYYIARVNGGIINKPLKINCHKTAKRIASNLVKCMPNVTRLRLESTTEDDVMVDFLAEIAFLYRQNMQKFECFVEGYLPQLHNAEKLKHIDMSLANWEFIPGRSIYPSSLKYLRMRAVNVQFDWNVFSSAIHPHNACFDQLRSLILYGDIREYSKRMFNEEITLALAFPALEFLAIRYIRLTPKHIKSTMLGPLNQLDFSGYSSDALRFIKHKHTHLKKLTLNFERGLEHDDAKFVTNSNAIFSNTSQIAKVGCNIIWGSVWFDFSNIHWKYVTHLGVHANFELYDLFHAVRGMTSLTSLVISIVHLGESNLGRAVKRIEEEKGTCSARVPCKVKTVTLDYGNGYHNVINLRADRQDWFSMAEAIFSLSV